MNSRRTRSPHSKRITSTEDRMYKLWLIDNGIIVLYVSSRESQKCRRTAVSRTIHYRTIVPIFSYWSFSSYDNNISNSVLVDGNNGIVLLTTNGGGTRGGFVWFSMLRTTLVKRQNSTWTGGEMPISGTRVGDGVPRRLRTRGRIQNRLNKTFTRPKPSNFNGKYCRNEPERKMSVLLYKNPLLSRSINHTPSTNVENPNVLYNVIITRNSPRPTCSR